MNLLTMSDMKIGIRRAILEGDIDKALKFTEMFYPHVLKENHSVYFKLRCRKFIEMVRKSAELNNGISRASNGHTFGDDIPNEMDVDENVDNGENGYADQMETEDGMGLDAPTVSPEQDILVAQTIQYGQQLQAEFKDDHRKESKTLNEVFALLAYANPLEVKEVAHLLDRKGRVTVAEELNSAILGKISPSDSLRSCIPMKLLTYILHVQSIVRQVIAVGAGERLRTDKRAARLPPRGWRGRFLRVCPVDHRRHTRQVATLLVRLGITHRPARGRAGGSGPGRCARQYTGRNGHHQRVGLLEWRGPGRAGP